MDINGGQHKDMDAIWLESLRVYYYILEYCLQQIILHTVLFYIVLYTLAARDPFSLFFIFSPLRLCGHDAALVFGSHFVAFELAAC